MKRTTIFAEEPLLKALRTIADREGQSLSATIRSALAEFVSRRKGAPPLPSFLGLGRSGRKDIAEHAEELLWTVRPRARKR